MLEKKTADDYNGLYKEEHKIETKLSCPHPSSVILCYSLQNMQLFPLKFLIKITLLFRDQSCLGYFQIRVMLSGEDISPCVKIVLLSVKHSVVIYSSTVVHIRINLNLKGILIS